MSLIKVDHILAFMSIDQIFFHLTYLFLLINSVTKLPHLSRFLQVLTAFSLGSYLTLSTENGMTWQIWSSAVVLFHLFFWKNYRSFNNKYEDLETEMWNDYFEDVSDDDFQLLLDSSDWRTFHYNGSIIADKDYFVLSITKDESSWMSLTRSESLVHPKDCVKLFIDRVSLREANPLLESTILHILTKTLPGSVAS